MNKKGGEMKAEKVLNLEEVNKKLQEGIRMLPEESQEQLRSSAEELDNITAEHLLLKKGLRVMLIVLYTIIIVLAALFISFGIYSGELEDTIYEKNAIISRYQKQDSLYSKLLDKNDALDKVSYRILNGEPVTYHQLLHMYDSLQEKYYTEQLNYERLQEVLSLINGLYPYKVSYEGGHTKVSGPNYKHQMEEAKALIDSLNRKNMAYRNDYELAKLKLELILKNYPIELWQDSNMLYIKAPKLDSALMLLPYYRDNLKYDADKKTWNIITIREREIITEREVKKKKKK